MLKKIHKFIIIILILILTLTGCYEVREKKYYADKNNYITDEAVVDNVIYMEEELKLVFWLSDIDETFQDNNFIIEGESVKLLIEAGILQKIKKGDTITYISAPKYFGDGYAMPIVEVIIGEEVLLSFDEGYSNLMKMY